MRYFEDFVLMSSETLPGRYAVAEEDIISFAEEWDPQPFHVDPTAAQQSMFGGIVACMLHVMAIAGKLTHSRDENDAALAGLGANNMQMFVPVRPGDILRLKNTVIDKRLSKSRPGTGIVTISSELVNQRDEVVYSCEHSTLFAARDTGSRAVRDEGAAV